MAYLYGDSTPADLGVDYIEFLRDALDFSVQVLAADERMRQGSARATEVVKLSDGEVARLEALGAAQAHAIENFDIGSGESATAQCAQALLRGAAETLRGSIERVRSAAAGDVGKLEEEARRDRERCVDALSAFLKRHDLPGMTAELRLQQLNGANYATRLYVKALDSLAAVIELDVPQGHLFAGVARVDKLIERLEVHAPESGGWLRKEVKLRPQRLDKEFITALVSNANESLIHLRTAADGTGVGFDLVVRNGARVKLSRIGEAGDAPPFDLDETDSAKVREFRDKLLAATADLRQARKSIVEAMLGDKPLREQRDPKMIVERLVAVMAPVVREIAKRSLGATELVLKRQTGDGRREEIFVSRKDLQQKLRPLGPAGRALFKPLDLGELPPEEAAPISLDKPKGRGNDDKTATGDKIGNEAGADKALADKAAADKVAADKVAADKAAADKAAADKLAADKLADRKRTAAERSLFAEALAVDKPASGRPNASPASAGKDEAVRLDDSLDRLIVTEETVRKPQ
ncbi:MAG: hypothetical protein JWN44_3756 [Myxococcales bacterium]|nr:hypothetical protein [Myxococcales bacterium]